MTNPAASTPVVPSEVGWQFVPQYYTFVNKQPDRLHCFYTKASTFTHGTEGEDVKPCFGQKEINDKIKSIGFQDCKVFIHSVDAQCSANGGIIIQVIGEMSNHGDPWRKFAQTFFLAEQPNGYFVLNDIFRFLKEETVDSDDDPDAPQEAAPAAPAEPPADVPAPAPAPADVSEPAKPPSPPPAAPSPPPAAPAEEPPTTDVPEPVPAPQTPTAAPNGVHTPEPETPAAPEPVPAAATPAPVAAPAPAAAPTPSKPATPAPAPAPPPAPAPAPAAPKTWASLAASNSNKWGAKVAQESRGVTESPAAPPAPAPAPAQPPAPRQPPQQQQQQQQPQQQPQPQQQQQQQQHPHHQHHQHHHQHQPTYGPLAAASITTAHCFVKGVTEPLTQPLLSAALTTRFGPIKDLEIVRSKACAFLEFHSIDAARRAIAASPIWVDVGGDAGQLRISVETKKERGERPPSRPRGGAPGAGAGAAAGAGAGGAPGAGGANVNGGEPHRGGYQRRGAPRGRGGAAGK